MRQATVAVLPPGAETPVTVTAETAWDWLSDAHPWQGTPLLERAELLGLCASGLITSDRSGDVLRAFDLIDLERESARYHWPPFAGAREEWPADVLAALAVVRSATSELERREIDAITARGQASS